MNPLDFDGVGDGPEHGEPLAPSRVVGDDDPELEMIANQLDHLRELYQGFDVDYGISEFGVWPGEDDRAQLQWRHFYIVTYAGTKRVKKLTWCRSSPGWKPNYKGAAE